jgi:pyruvate formate lyase activating enzyme
VPQASGVVFDIQRFSLNDGPGIRTTVFLKGCPLNCAWCHNPESISPAPQLSFNAIKCTRCRLCAKACRKGVHSFGPRGHRVAFGACAACGACVRVCPNSALRIIGARMTVPEVMREVLSDADYYGRSGGGMTLSGGEPMLQYGFALALLKAARGKRIHTVVETNGTAAPGRYREIARFTDLFLLDWKATEPAKHRALTGVDNAPILRNLDLLYRMGKAIVLRCPLVPGVNDSDAHLRGIAGLARRYPRLAGVEIMAYHDFGTSKSRNIGRRSRLRHLRTVDEGQKEAWLKKLASLGCRKVKFG